MPKCLKSYADYGKATEYRNRQRKTNYEKGAAYAFNGYKKWLKSEDKLILKNGFTDRELAKILYRSVQAIQIRRCRINKNRGEYGKN